MYSHCIRCRRPFGRNAEIEHLPTGRRIAVDAEKGRLWVVCANCDQWNLVPLEERWEAVAECERLAIAAESRGGTAEMGMARTRDGLELCRVGGLHDLDIANWRYGRRLARRQTLVRWIAVALGAVSLALGARAGIETRSAGFGAYVAVAALALAGVYWREPPRAFPTAVRVGNERLLIWPWQRRDIRIAGAGDAQHPAVIIPNGAIPRRLEGRRAAEFLAQWLPRINGASCAEASVRRAVARVDEAESEAKRAETVTRRRRGRRSRRAAVTAPIRLRPWEVLVASSYAVRLVDLSAEDRLALEMTVTEEMEQAELESEAGVAAVAFAEQAEIAGIADDLLIPSSLMMRLEQERENRDRPGVGPVVDGAKSESQDRAKPMREC